MVRTGNAIGVLAAAMVALGGSPATADVLNAVYRGTLVCDKLPFTDTKMREAIVVTIAGVAARYTHVVRLKAAATETVAEQGYGSVVGQNIRLQGSWSGEIPAIQSRLQWYVRAAHCQAQRDANLDRRWQDHCPRLFRRYQAPAEGVSTARQNVAVSG